MPPQIASIVCALGIAGLFWLDRERGRKVSAALWVPSAWIAIAGSRMVSQWLDMAPASSSEAYLEGSPVDRGIFAALMAMGIIVLVSRARKVGRMLSNNAPILLYFGYCAVSVLWSDYPDVAFKRWTKAIGDLVMILIVLTERDRSVALEKLFSRVAFVLLPISVLFIKYYPDFGRGYSRWEGKLSYTGVTTDKNMLGMLCLVTGLGTVWRFLGIWRDKENPRRNKLLLAHGTVLAIALWLLELAGSATSSSCFVLGATLLVLSGLRAFRRNKSLIHIVAAAMLLISFSAMFLDQSLLRTVGRDPTLTGRTEIWHTALSLAKNKMFGTGFESFWLGKRLEQIWRVYWFHPIEAHNGYLETYLNLGWFGIGILAIVIVTGYRNVVQMLKRDPEAARLRLAFLVVALTYNLTEAAIHTQSLVWIAFIVSAMKLSQTKSAKVRVAEPAVTASAVTVPVVLTAEAV